MSQSVDQHVVQQFTDGIEHLQQQKGTRLRGSVDVDPKIVGDRAYYNQIGATSVSKRTGRHGDTEYTDTPHFRRMVSLESFDVADLLDKDDKVQMLTDPTNSYTQAFAMAMGRQQDDTIIEAFAAVSKTGKEGTGSESFPADREIAAGGENLTITKILDAKEKLDEKEVDDEDRFFAISASQLRGLLGATEVTNIDYNNVKALVKGEVDTYAGFTFIRTERLILTGAIRDCYCWHKMSMKLGIGINPNGEVDVLPTKKYSVQVYYEGRFGATRMDAVGVVRVKCDQT